MCIVSSTISVLSTVAAEILFGALSIGLNAYFNQKSSD